MKFDVKVVANAKRVEVIKGTDGVLKLRVYYPEIRLWKLSKEKGFKASFLFSLLDRNIIVGYIYCGGENVSQEDF